MWVYWRPPNPSLNPSGFAYLITFDKPRRRHFRQINDVKCGKPTVSVCVGKGSIATGETFKFDIKTYALWCIQVSVSVSLVVSQFLARVYVRARYCQRAPVHPSVCPSVVCPSVCHTREPRLNGLRYRNNIFFLDIAMFIISWGQIL